MRSRLLLLVFGHIFFLAVYGQSNLPVTATGPGSATAKPLPGGYIGASTNYLRTLVPRKAVSDSSLVTISSVIEDVLATTEYFDDLNRPLQKVVKQGSPLKKDYVLPYTFDEFSRMTTQYLPYVQQTGNTNDGKFKDNQFVNDSLFYRSAFPNEHINYKQRTYDASPLQKLVKITAEGNSWTGANRGIVYNERTNTTSDSVRLWIIDITNEDDVPTTSSIYTPGSLHISETIDERGVKSLTYTDELGRVILDKKQNLISPSTGHFGWFCTYYVYDESNHLRMIIPPRAVEALETSGGWNLVSNNTINAGLCYAYYYDDRGRITMKRIPGKGKTFISYDLFDRVVMVQDSKIRATNQWAFIKYDGQGRRIKTGLITTTLVKDSIIKQAARSLDYPALSGTYIITSEVYYDDYNWIATTGAPLTSSLVTTNINSTNFYTTYNSSPEYAQQITISARIKGNVTGIKKLLVGSSSYLFMVSLYDDHGRTVQTKETNYTGGTDVITKQFSFSGQILRAHLQHQKSGSNAQNHTLLTKYSYDHSGRVKSVTKNIDNLADKTVGLYSYNELGQLQTKVIGSSIETQNLEYNIRGWLTSINKGFIDTSGSTSSFFGEAVFYDYGFTNNQFNGAIAGVKWKAGGDGIARAYGFAYDNTNRLTSADFSQQNIGSTSWTKDKVDFSVDGLKYDGGGNILSMRQKGLKLGGPLSIDSLTYQYFANSNQLQKVIDGIIDDAPLGDFKDTTLAGDDYAYDENGNITKDYNRKMYTTGNGAGAVYNYLDRPDSVVIAGKSTVHYYYDASGARLRRQVNDYTTGSLVSKNYMYVNGFVYLNDTLQYVLQEEGRIRYAQKKNSQTGSLYYAFEYDYFLRDHLGNVRTVLTEGRDTASYAATMESLDSATVRALFSNVYDPVNTIYPKPTAFDSDAGNHFVSRLNASSGVSKKIGPSLVLKVMAGDQVQLNTFAYYATATQSPGSGPNLLNDLINILSSGVINNSSGKLVTADQTGLNNVLNPGFTQFLDNDRSYDNARPKAYLNWILFDEQFNYVASNSGVQQVLAGTSKQALVAPLQSISKNGYLYVYVSNESPQDVFFDDISVKHFTGPLLQEQSYYPFGLEMAGISGKALNKLASAYKYNGGVELDEVTNLYTTFYRQYDAQLGRFYGVDILSEETSSFSTYQFGYNNPLLFNDPMGDKARPPQFNTVAELFNYIQKNGVAAFPEGFTLFEAGDGGVITDTWVGGSLGTNSKGKTGVYFTSSSESNSTEGGENMMQEFILKTKFVSLDRFRADWNAWSAHQNFKDWLEVPGKTNAIIGLESNIIKWGTDQAVHGIRSTLGGTASQVSSAISTRKALSTLGDTFNVIGKVSGVGDIISSGVDFILTMNDPTASTGDKVLAGGKVVADILITFAKMHPGVRLAGTIVSFFW